MANRVEPYVRVDEVVRRAPNLLDVTGTSNIGVVIVSPVGPELAYIQGPKQFLDTYTIGGVIPRNADISFINAYYLSFTASLVVARSMNSNCVGGLLVAEGETPVKVKFKSGQLLSKLLTITTEITKEDEWSFVINDTVFFKGSYSKISNDETYESYQLFTECNDLSDVADALSHWSEIDCTLDEKKLKIYHTGLNFVTEESKNKNITITIPTSDEDSDPDTPETPTNEEVISIEKDKWLFSIIPSSAQIRDIYALSVDTIDGDDKNFKLNLEYPDPDGGDDPKIDTFVSSLYTEATDPNGANSYLDNINSLKNYQFEVKVYKTDHKMKQVSRTTFGESGLDLEASAKPFNLARGIDSLGDQAMYDIEYLAPCGITNLAFLKRYLRVGRVNDWFTPVDVPADRTNASSIQQYFRYIDNHSNTYACGPFDKNSGLTGWNNLIACSTLYYEKVMLNKSNGAEFAPVFDVEYGTIQMVNPVFEFGKTDREKLLNFGMPINFVKYDQRKDLYYMNDNWTHQNVNDILSEEQNRRLINKIKKDIKRLMGQFKGKFNTVSTRENVVSILTYYFQNTIMNKKFPPDAFDIVCDETNNPAEIIRANKLKVLVRVRLYNSIKYIDVLNEVFPIGVDFVK